MSKKNKKQHLKLAAHARESLTAIHDSERNDYPTMAGECYAAAAMLLIALEEVYGIEGGPLTNRPVAEPTP